MTEKKEEEKNLLVFLLGPLFFLPTFSEVEEFSLFLYGFLVRAVACEGSRWVNGGMMAPLLLSSG